MGLDGLYEELRKAGEERRKAGGSYFLLHTVLPMPTDPFTLVMRSTKG